MSFKSQNPFTLEVLQSHSLLNGKQLKARIRSSQKAFQNWRILTIDERAQLFRLLADELKSNKQEYADAITLEMGKPITESIVEVEKCATTCIYYADNASKFLEDQQNNTVGKSAWVTFEPIGGVLGIMPWNFPFWQVFRFAIPTLLAGNTILVKHASNVPKCAILIERAFRIAGFAEGIYENLFISDKKVKSVIENPFIQGVSLTGSEAAGKAVAKIAGENIKRCVLELGGSNAFLIFADADLSKTVKMAVRSRFQNTGQSCIAAKRFIIHRDIYHEFQNAFAIEIMKLKVGDPSNKQTQIGPLARLDLAETLDNQLKKSIKKGAKLLLGGNKNNCLFHPTLLGEVKPGMPAFDQETFGPLACLIKAENDQEMINLANQSSFGLGVNLFSENTEYLKSLIPRFDEGSVFINEIVKSDPALPFGGVKKSGIGRELGEEGIKAFVNIKTVVLGS